MTRGRIGRLTAGFLIAIGLVGCGTTRMTDTARTATEQLLVSQAADNAIGQIDFSPLSGKTVYLDSTGIDKDVLDKGYLVSLVRQHIVAAGAFLQDDKPRAEYVVDLRVGGLGTDRNSVLLGTPAVQLPSVLPGMPTSIPELAVMKKNDQRGVAKVAVFAYNRITGRALWQSGTAEAMSQAKDTWVLGTGPFSRGTIRRRAEFSGEPLPAIPLLLGGDPNPNPNATNKPEGEQYFPNPEVPVSAPIIPGAMLGVTGAAAVGGRPVVR